HARVLAENPQVTQMLRERSHELQLVLRQAGIDADEVSVSVGNHGELNNSGDSSSFDKQFSDSRHGVPGGMGGDSQLAAPLSNSSGQMQVDLDHWIA
ncbi:MAG: hypothetical protein KDD42_04810, partial [Bdellovibrionales bacterium]|nr:hypothetical protein [Bdellovibrionales bacterium]